MLRAGEHARLRDDIRRDEGLRLKVYKCPADKWTIGYGRNVEDRGITHAEAEYMLDNDIVSVASATYRVAVSNYIDWNELTESQRVGLCNMCFQLGERGLGGFRKMWAALRAGNKELAAQEALDSRWAKQTPARAQRVADMLRAEA